jgi:sulfofructose kinase
VTPKVLVLCDLRPAARTKLSYLLIIEGPLLAAGVFIHPEREVFMIELDVLCVGHACWDLAFRVSHHPAADEKMFAEEFVSCGGGPAANAAVAAARLGCRAGFAGYLGNDAWGDLHVGEFVREGVYLDFLKRGAAPTPLAAVLVKPDGSRAVANSKWDDRFLPEDILDLSGTSPKVILFDGHEPVLSPALNRTAKERGIRTVLDAGSVHAGTRALADKVDFLVCSERFAVEWTGQSDSWVAAGRLAVLAPSVVITLGSRGLVWKNRDGGGRMPAFRVGAVDTTGAGDAFHGAFAAVIASGWTWEKNLTFANAAGALACTKFGGRTAIPTRVEVMTFLETNGIRGMDEKKS